MIDAWEELDKIGFQIELMTAHVVLRSVNGAMRALPSAVGVAVKEESAFEQRFQDVDDGVVISRR